MHYKKRILWFFLFSTNLIFAQTDSLKTNVFSNYIKPTPVYPLYPESFLNVGLGLGSGYGGMGTKAVFGYKNSGLCVGLGLNGPFGGLGYTFGFQMSYKFLYLSFSYGTYSITLSNNTDYLIPNGLHNAIGMMIGLGKSKRNFLDVGIEISYSYTFTGNRSSYHSAGGTIGTYLYSNSSSQGKEPSHITYVGIVLGYGYRIGNSNIWKRKS